MAHITYAMEAKIRHHNAQTEMVCSICDSQDVYATSDLHWNGHQWALPSDPLLWLHCEHCGVTNTHETPKHKEIKL